MNLNQGESEDKFREYLFDENNKLMILLISSKNF